MSDRRASATDRDNQVYARKRAALAKRRRALDRQDFDPGPPNDDDWTMGDDVTDQLVRLRAPEQVQQLIDGFVQRKGWSSQLHNAAVWTNWHQIVGPELAQRCEPVRLKNGNLQVRAENQMWATQLQYFQTTVLQRCSDIVGPNTVRRISIIVGNITRESSPGDGYAHH
ncbi:MAG: DUF721 domain-containing protein [Nitriliruptoraceae bacterium]